MKRLERLLRLRERMHKQALLGVRMRAGQTAAAERALLEWQGAPADVQLSGALSTSWMEDQTARSRERLAIQRELEDEARHTERKRALDERQMQRLQQRQRAERQRQQARREQQRADEWAGRKAGGK